MKAEINRLILLTGDGVIEAPVEVPRRQYIDFHSDLYPAVASKGEHVALGVMPRSWERCL